MDINDIFETIKGGAMPTILLGIIGFFIKKEMKEAKEIRNTNATKIDSIITSMGNQDKNLAVMQEKLDNHIEADEKVQKHIDESITEIKRKVA